MRLPCIVCGKRPHDGAYHEVYRREYRACKNLLRRTWPRLRGLAALSAPALPAPRRDSLRWYAKVLTRGQVAHLPVRPGDRGYGEAG